MISDRRGAPGRLGALFNRLPSQQLGIGYYEAVSGATEDPEPAVAEFPGGSGAPPRVVDAPESGSAAPVAQRAAGSALAVMGILACGVAAVWAGNKLVRQMRGQSA